MNNGNVYILQDTAREHRARGQTTWLLEGAYQNPQCIIVVHLAHYVRDIKRDYVRLVLSKETWWQRFKKRHFGWTNPKLNALNMPEFLCLDNLSTKIRGSCRPIMFDNSCFMDLIRL